MMRWKRLAKHYPDGEDGILLKEERRKGRHGETITIRYIMRKSKFDELYGDILADMSLTDDEKLAKMKERSKAKGWKHEKIL